MREVGVTFAVVTAVLAAACAIGEERTEDVEYPARVRSQSRVCESPFTKVDVANAKPCGNGRGHCYDASRVPVDDLTAEGCAAGEACVPDAILASNGAKLKTCKFFIGAKPGACLSTLVNQVDKNKDVLQKDACADDERCVPCVDPTNGKDTQVCDAMGVHVDACKGGSAEPPEVACCHGAGTCLREDGVPEDSRDSLSPDVCPAKQLCAPRAMVSGSPVACDVLGVRGVCLDLCFARMLGPSTPVTRGGCAATEVCLPCVIGKGQGMPGCE